MHAAASFTMFRDTSHATAYSVATDPRHLIWYTHYGLFYADRSRSDEEPAAAVAERRSYRQVSGRKTSSTGEIGKCCVPRSFAPGPSGLQAQSRIPGLVPHRGPHCNPWDPHSSSLYLMDGSTAAQRS